MTATPETPPTLSRRSKAADPPAPPAANIHTALIAAAVNFGPLDKDAENPYYKSKYLSLGALLNSVRPALSDEGILITSSFVLLTQGWVVETTLHHAPSGTELTSQFPVADATNSQKVGASGTFGMRYNLLQLLGVAAADDDGNSAADLTQPDEFLGPPPAGQQRTEPRRMPTNGVPASRWSAWL